MHPSNKTGAHSYPHHLEASRRQGLHRNLQGTSSSLMDMTNHSCSALLAPTPPPTTTHNISRSCHRHNTVPSLHRLFLSLLSTTEFNWSYCKRFTRRNQLRSCVSTRTRRLFSWKRRCSNRPKQTETTARPDLQSGRSIFVLEDSLSCTSQAAPNYLKPKMSEEDRDQTTERRPHRIHKPSGSTFRIRTCSLFVSWLYAGIILLLLPLSILNTTAAIPLAQRSESSILSGLGRRGLSHRLYNKGIAQFSNAVAMNLSNIPACDSGTMTGFNNRGDEISQEGPIRVAAIHHGKSAIMEDRRQKQLLATSTEPRYRSLFFRYHSNMGYYSRRCKGCCQHHRNSTRLAYTRERRVQQPVYGQSNHSHCQLWQF